MHSEPLGLEEGAGGGVLGMEALRAAWSREGLEEGIRGGMLGTEALIVA